MLPSANSYKPQLTARKQMLPFARPDMGSAEMEAVLKVLRSGWLTSGPQVEQFEIEFARAVGAKKAVALHSCTAALHLAAAAWKLGPEDAVILPAITFIATAEVFTYLSCLPLVLDVDRDSYLLSPVLVREFIHKQCIWKNKVLIHRRSKRQVRALVPVHLGGRPCEMDELWKIADQYGLKILDDAAHAFPAAYKGRQVGSLADATAFSFYATKNLSTGEGGMLTTDDLELAAKVGCMRLHGIESQSCGYKRWHYDVVCDGYKYNMTDICAALGRVQLKRLAEMQRKRQSIHDFYEQELQGLACIRTNPPTPYGSAYHLYAIEILSEFGINRERFVEEMYARNIGLSLHFIPLYRLSHYRKKYGLSLRDYPNSEAIYQKMVSLPLYSAMSLKDAQDVVAALQDVRSSYAHCISV